jgi:hypothetical protein
VPSKKFNKSFICIIVIAYIAFLPAISIENSNFINKPRITIEANDQLSSSIMEEYHNSEGKRVTQPVINSRTGLQIEKLPIPDVNSPIVINLL